MVRRSLLAGSWYPDSKGEIESLLSEWTTGVSPAMSFAGIVPHAGWYYSGKTAAQVLKKTVTDKDLIVVIGGHLPAGSNILAAMEDKILTPCGELVNRLDLIERLGSKLRIEEDFFDDNTVEIVLPMISSLTPNADIIWLRAPADLTSVRLAEEIYNLTEVCGLKTAVIGSTDLTHYGSNYSFIPAGTGPESVKWVKDVNDAGIIRNLLKLDCEGVLEHAASQKSACSAGAAVAAVRFAQLNDVSEGLLIDYHTSWDIKHAESFVGYAGIVY